METTITADELTRALEEASQRFSDPGSTLNELREQTGMAEKAIRSRLRVLMDQGRLQAGRKTIRTIDGREWFAPCYRITKAKKK